MNKRAIGFAVLALVILLSAEAFAQQRYFCVKPDGTPLCAIDVPAFASADPSVLCNQASPQCSLACLAQGGEGAMAKFGAMGLPVIALSQDMLTGREMVSQPESPEMCQSQYMACVEKCRMDPMNAQNQSYLNQCLSACQSVFSGCGAGNREIQ